MNYIIFALICFTPIIIIPTAILAIIQSIKNIH